MRLQDPPVQRREATTLTVVVVLAVAAALLAHALSWFDTSFGAIDAFPVYAAGNAVIAGQPDAVYDPRLWTEPGTGHPFWQAQVERYGAAAYRTTYGYHPLYLYLWLPLVAVLSYPGFVAAVLVINLVSAVFVGAECLRRAGFSSEDPVRRYAAGAGVLAVGGVSEAVLLGQNVLPALALLLLSLRLFQAERPVPAGLAFLVALSFKPWLTPLLLVFAVAGQHRRAAAMVAAWFASFVVAPLVVLPGLMAAYSGVSAGAVRTSVVAINNVSLSSFLLRLSDPDWLDRAEVWRGMPLASWQVTTSLGASVGVAVLALALIRRNALSESRLWSACLALVVVPVPMLWAQNLVFVLPVSVWLLLRRDQPRVQGFGAIAFFVLAAWYPLTRFDGWWKVSGTFTALLLFAVWATVVASALVALATPEE